MAKHSNYEKSLLGTQKEKKAIKNLQIRNSESHQEHIAEKCTESMILKKIKNWVTVIWQATYCFAIPTQNQWVWKWNILPPFPQYTNALKSECLPKCSYRVLPNQSRIKESENETSCLHFPSTETPCFREFKNMNICFAKPKQNQGVWKSNILPPFPQHRNAPFQGV